MPNSDRQLCPKCRKDMSLQLQPGGKSPRRYQCLDCERPDPLQSQTVSGIFNGLKPPE
jgi:hypothetical protein